MGSTDATAKFIEQLGKRFQINVEKVEYFLGLQIKRFDNCIQINQSAYVKRILEKYNMMDAKPLPLPIKPGWTPGESPPFNNTEQYREMVGSLMYLTQGARPDLSYAVNVASRVQDSPTQAHYALLERIFRYLKSTITDGIKFTKDKYCSIEAHSNADHSGTEAHKWRPAQVPWGSVVWKSKLQQCVALSSLAAEYVTASEACKSLVWLDRLLKEIGAVDELSVPVSNW
ncbi:secreted RxLR effector protein 161-like [Schistocerca piceifrons]|uniref:secreted RxLR effector protein 161-like n=1 Tax=Schistocerca piceifrons TaxID=274613 RepID=UPI001F5EF0A1|nr:secreted RxLR effector protein 161-like [Schistocerca piceifrons]